MLLTAYLKVGTLLAGANVDKVKRGTGLGEADGEFSKVVLANGLADARKVGKDLCDNLDVVLVVVEVVELVGYGGAEGVGSLFAAFEALPDPVFLELRARKISTWVARMQERWLKILTMRPSPSIRASVYEFRFCCSQILLVAQSKSRVRALCRIMGVPLVDRFPCISRLVLPLAW